jgi:DNA-binding NarL/FixJ family response regulator
MGYRRCRKRGGTCGATLLGYASSPKTTSEVIRAAAGHMKSNPNVASSVSWEVLALVAEGHSNGQIATSLYISPKTASVHVSNILAKLDVSTRTEAATLAHRLGLLPT